MADASTSRLPFLDGLRGVAALVVVISHLTIAFRPQAFFGKEQELSYSWLSRFAISPLFVFVNGSFAVFIFFVLSGFVISASADRNRGSIIGACVARIVRLSLPAGASILFAAAILNLGLLSVSPVAEIVGHWWVKRLPAYLGTSVPWTTVLKDMLGQYYLSGEVRYNGVLWTMPKELAGSIVLYIAFLSSSSLIYRISLITLSFVACLWLDLTPNYYVCFALGFLAYLCADNIRRMPGWVGLFLILAGLIGGGEPFFPPPPESIYFLPYAYAVHLGLERYIWPMAAAVLLAGIMSSGMAKQMLSGPVPQFLGRVSFSVYLIHIPLLWSVMAFLYIQGGYRSDVCFLAASLAFICVVYLLGFLFTVGVDQPAMLCAAMIRSALQPRGKARHPLMQRPLEHAMKDKKRELPPVSA